MTGHTALERMGFDTSRLHYHLRTALAACGAIYIAWLIGLEHPQWSGMTVWAASQPIRGHLLEKSFFRIAGTILGSLYGIGLIVASHDQTWMIVVGLSLWIGLCVGAGNVLRGFVSYGAMLAGYSAAMVTLLHSSQSGSGLAVGIDRMATVLVGVLIALVVGWLFAARSSPDDLVPRVRKLTARVLDDLAAQLAAIKPPGDMEHHHLLAEMAAIEDELDGHAAGSRRSRETVRTIRRVLSAQVAALLWMRRPLRPDDNSRLAAALADAAAALHDAGQQDIFDAALRRAAGLAASDAALGEALSGLRDAMAESAAIGGKPDPVLVSHPHPVVLHRDWIGAREAALRAGGMTLAAGLLWLATGWAMGSFLMLGTAIMTTVFSTADNPVQTMRFVVFGQIAGAAGALSCRWLLWPLASGQIELILSMMPFVLLGAFIFAHRRTTRIAFDYNMVMLLLLQPTWPLTGDFAGSLATAAAVVLGPLVAMMSYRFVFPIDGRRRLQTLISMMVHEIEAMAARPDASTHRPVWRARLYHRVLRLVRWAEKTGNSREHVIDGSFAVLMLGSAILHMDSLLRTPEQRSPATTRRLNATLARLRKVGDDPRRAARALADTATRLAGDPAVDRTLLREAASELSACERFFLGATTHRG